MADQRRAGYAQLQAVCPEDRREKVQDSVGSLSQSCYCRQRKDGRQGRIMYSY